MRIFSRLLMILAASFFLSGTAIAQTNSGYLEADTYAKLKDTKSPSGEKVKRWVAPGVTPGNYTSVWIDKPVFYPEPQGTDQVNANTLQQITVYMNEALHRELTGVVQLVNEPGPKTLHFKPAITAAAVKKLGLKPYQYIPVAFILSGGSGGKGASLALEYDAIDTDTNKIVAAGMRETSGPKLKDANQVLTLDDFKPIIDIWAKDMAATFKSGTLTE